MTTIKNKLDELKSNLNRSIDKLSNQCDFNFGWNLFGVDTTIIGLISGIIFAYKIAWFINPLRIISYIIGIVLFILVVTLWRWNRSLIKSISELREIASGLTEEASSLQNNHQALARDYEKFIDRFDSLSEQHSVLMTIVQLIHPDIQASVNNVRNNRV